MIPGYVVRELIGRGGSGAVYRARHMALGRDVALKLLEIPLTGDEESLRRQQREVDIQKGLSHPHLVKLFDAGAWEGGIFLAMELVEGGGLHKQYPPRDLDHTAAVAVILQVAGGLQCLHSSGIVHRDLKPANLLVTREGVVKIADYGLARSTTQTMITRPGSLIGTPAYLAPEGLAGGEMGTAADVYSLGVILYELVTGTRPHVADRLNDLIAAALTAPLVPARVHRPDLPAWLDEVISASLATRPENRVALEELVRRLESGAGSGAGEDVMEVTSTDSGESAAAAVPSPVAGKGRTTGPSASGSSTDGSHAAGTRGTSAGAAGSRAAGPSAASPGATGSSAAPAPAPRGPGAGGVKTSTLLVCVAGAFACGLMVAGLAMRPGAPEVPSGGAVDLAGAPASPVQALPPSPATPGADEWFTRFEESWIALRRTMWEHRGARKVTARLGTADRAGEFAIEQKYRDMLEVCLAIHEANAAAPERDLSLVGGMAAEACLDHDRWITPALQSALKTDLLPRLAKILAAPSSDPLQEMIRRSLRSHTSYMSENSTRIPALEELIGELRKTRESRHALVYEVLAGAQILVAQRVSDLVGMATNPLTPEGLRVRVQQIEAVPPGALRWPEHRALAPFLADSMGSILLSPGVPASPRLLALEGALQLCEVLPAGLMPEYPDLANAMNQLKNAIKRHAGVPGLSPEERQLARTLQKAMKRFRMEIHWGKPAL